MAKRLQKYAHREVDYNRPNQKWRCGHTACGKECPLGPTGGGKCQGSGECLPVRKGDRWLCTRPESRGGECGSGPGPDGACGCPLTSCQPIRTHRYLRRLTVFAAAAITLGFLLISVLGIKRDAAVNPGMTTHAHAGENLSCSSCHSETSLAGVVSLGKHGGIHEKAMANSKLCLECHGEEMGEWISEARFAHGWDEGERVGYSVASVEPASISETPLAVWLASKSDTRRRGREGSLACSTCHQEHHGSEASLTTLTNNQCQVCHSKQFHSFDQGHPTFAETAYPYARRNRIFFDHESHYGKHFNQRTKLVEGQETNWPPQSGVTCRECHETDSAGDFMKLKGYEASCAKCHDENFVRGGTRLTLFAIPEVDSRIAEGRWPRSRMGLLPSTRLLLSKETKQLLGEIDASEPAGKHESIKDEKKFGEIWLNDESRNEAAKVVTADLQQLFYGVWNEGTGVLLDRLEATGFLASEDLHAAVSGLPASVVREFLFPGYGATPGDIDFPDIDVETLNERLAIKSGRSVGLWPESASRLSPLMLELLSHRGLSYSLRKLIDKEEDGAIRIAEDGTLDLSNLEGASDAEIQAVESVAWEIKEMFLELNERQAPFLKELNALRGGILDTGSDTGILDELYVSARSDEKFLAGVEEEVERFREDIFPPRVDAPGVERSTTDAGEDDSFGTAASADDDFGAPAGDDDFGAPAGDDDFGAPADDTFSAPVEAVAEPEPKGTEKFRVFELSSPGNWQHSGGWLYDSNAIHYAAQTHADPVVKAWIEAAVTAANSAEADLSAEGLRILSHTLEWRDGVESNTTGRCLQCHTIDRDARTKKFQVNWYAAYGAPETSRRTPDLTRFSHEKHFISLDCLYCHQPKEEGDYQDFFPYGGKNELEIAHPEKFLPISMLAEEFSPNFQPMNEKAQCATCHQENKAGNSCLQCHSYHSLGH